MTALPTKAATNAVTPLLRPGDTDLTIAFRAAGHEGIYLQAPDHGVQQLANFNPALGDYLALDNILGLTLASTNLSDVGRYVTSQAVNGGTMLFVDPTGASQQGTPFAFLQGITTTVGQLVAEGAVKYTAEAKQVTPVFNAPLALRTAGLETIMLNAIAPGAPPQQINGFNATAGDRLELANILNKTLALPDLANMASYITVTNSGGNTFLSFDPTGQGLAGTAFLQLNGVTLTLAQLLAANALAFDPTWVAEFANPGQPFTFRAEGNEIAKLSTLPGVTPATQMLGFSLTNGDVVNGGNFLQKAGIASGANAQTYFSSVETGGNTQIWFNPAGTGQGGTLVATLTDISVSMTDLLSHNAFSTAWESTNIVTPTALMRMGCTNVTIAYRSSGSETVCLTSPSHGEQQLANFNPAAGDVIGIDDILELTQAHANLSDVANYITSQVVNGGTMLYVDTTGEGRQGTPIAFLQGVTTTVAALVADGGMQYVPDAIAVAPSLGATLALRPDGLETVILQPAPGLAPAQLNDFNASLGDKLELANVLNHTLAMPNLSDIANYITATSNGGNTILSVDPTGHGGSGTAFAVLTGETVTVAQLLANSALIYDPTNIAATVIANTPFTFRAAGAETGNLLNVQGSTGVQQLTGFSLNEGDGINVAHILGAAAIQADLSNIQAYFSTVETGGNTQLWFNANGAGQGGVLEAVFQNTSVSMTDLLAHSAVHMAM